VLRFEEALERILALADPPLPSEDAALEDAEGRVLAGDLIAPADLPGFDYSAMDGYAVRTVDVAKHDRLPVRGESRPGAVPPSLEPGAAMRIFTGAELPHDADAVVMQENVTREGDVVTITKKPRAGQHVRRRGDDIRAGSVAIEKGTRLRPAHLALAAAVDRARVSVAARPVVAILATGDELRAPGTEAKPGSIPDANTVALRAMARRAGATARAFPFVRDDRRATEDAFAAALEEADVLVTIGGVSVGDHDLVRPALEAVGVTLDFWRVAIKPGKPLAVGSKPRSGKRPAITIGLPGNPASAIVTFALFGVPLLRALQGDSRPMPRLVRAKTTREHAHEPGRLEIARATLAEDDDGGLLVTTFANQASGAVTSMAAAEALVFVPEDATSLPAGAQADVLLLADL
jgi:molybdopterin molybdotransferase